MPCPCQNPGIPESFSARRCGNCGGTMAAIGATETHCIHRCPACTRTDHVPHYVPIQQPELQPIPQGVSSITLSDPL